MTREGETCAVMPPSLYWYLIDGLFSRVAAVVRSSDVILGDGNHRKSAAAAGCQGCQI